MVYSVMTNLEKIKTLKMELDSYRPLSEEVLRNLEQWFEVELTYSSNAIEGNTLTRQETALVLEKGLTVGGKPMKDHLEALNHREALNFMKTLVDKQKIALNDILSLYQLILKGIDDKNSGCIRDVPVRLLGSAVVLPNPLKVPQLLDEFSEWMQRTHENPVYFAALAHYRLVSIHPFVDGNGRTARLLMNLILMQHGYPPAIIRPKYRLAYIKGLEKAQLGGTLDEYLKVIYDAVFSSLQIYIKAVRQEQPESHIEMDALLKIGDLAKTVHETVSTLRYWTKLGLLTVKTTTPSGYQLYDPDAIDRCHRIRELQKQRFTLDEISTMF